MALLLSLVPSLSKLQPATETPTAPSSCAALTNAADRADERGIAPEMLAHKNGTEDKADGPKHWVASKDQDIKVRSGGHGSMNVYSGASSTRSGTGGFEHIENSMWARLYGQRLIDHLLERSRG